MKLIEVPFSINTPTSVSRGPGGTAWDLAVDRSKEDDATYQQMVGPYPAAGMLWYSERLVRQGFTTPAKISQYPLHSLVVSLNADGGGVGATDVYADQVYLVKGGSILTSVNNGTTTRFTGEQTQRYTFTAAQLASLGVTRLDLLGNPTDFGCAAALTIDDTVAIAGFVPQIDQLSLIAVLMVEEESMDYHRAAKAGGYRVLLEEAMPSISSSTQIFANAPAGTVFIDVRVDTADLVIRFNTAAVSGGVMTDTISAATTSNGLKFFANERPRLPMNQQTAKRARAIQSGGTTTGWIVYWGLDNTS